MKKFLISLLLFSAFVVLPVMADSLTTEEQEAIDAWSDSNAEMAASSSGVYGLIGTGFGAGYEMGVPAASEWLVEAYTLYSYPQIADPICWAVYFGMEVLVPIYQIPLGDALNIGFHAGGSLFTGIGLTDTIDIPEGYSPLIFPTGIAGNVRAALYLGNAENGALFIGLDGGVGVQFVSNQLLYYQVNLVAGIGL